MIFIPVLGCPARRYAFDPTSAIRTREKVSEHGGLVFRDESFFAGRFVDACNSLGAN
jgi:hypothetical protein